MSRIRRSLLLSFAQRYSVMVIRLCSLLTLSRLLSPHDFGIQAALLAVFLIVTTIAEFGVTTYVVKERELTEARFRTVSSLTLIVAIFIAAVLAGATIWLPSMFLTPEVATSLLILAPVLVLHGFTTPVIAMLERRFLFGVHFIIGVSSTFLSVALAILLALYGFGYMSLVWGTVAEYTIRFALALCYVRKTGWGLAKPVGWRSVARFGIDMTALNGLQIVGQSVPKIIVGSMLGLEAVGLLARSQTVTQLFDRAIIDGVQPIIQPALTSAALNGVDLDTVYHRKVSLLSALAWPFFTFLILMAEPAILLILGHQWGAATHTVQILCLIGFILPFNSMVWRFHIAEGLMRQYMYVQVAVLAASLMLVFAAGFISVEAVCVAAVIESLLRGILSHRLLHSTGRYHIRPLMPNLCSSVLIAAICAIPPVAAIAMNAVAIHGPLVTFLVTALCSAILWIGTVMALGHELSHEALHIAGRAKAIVLASPVRTAK
jgi:O-antigen/teichoic acid export membrane protein